MPHDGLPPPLTDTVPALVWKKSEGSPRGHSHLVGNAGVKVFTHKLCREDHAATEPLPA